MEENKFVVKTERRSPQTGEKKNDGSDEIMPRHSDFEKIYQQFIKRYGKER
ncbi:MAG: hypothetical protein QXK47_02385 [Candidatus Bathyarchaeia archaeon]